MCIYSLGRPSNVLSLNEICNYILSPLIKRYKLLLLRKRNYQITFKEEEFALEKIFLIRRKYIFDFSTLFHKSLPLFPRGLSLIRSLLAKTGFDSMKNPPFLERVRSARYPYYPIHERATEKARTCLPMYACLHDRVH